MSSTTEIELQSEAYANTTSLSSRIHRPNATEEPPQGQAVVTTMPDGGYGWTVVGACAVMTFWVNGFSYSWGVLQTALLGSSLQDTSTATISFVGTLSLATAVTFGLLCVRMMRLVGARITALVGVLLLGAGIIASGFATSNVGGLFGTAGFLTGLGSCLIYSVCNVLPTQYFNTRIGLANGIIKLGGGIGGTVLAVALEALIRAVGLTWTFRVIGFLTLLTGVPAALLIKERNPIRNAPFIELSMFRSLPYTAVFCAGALVTFALFVPPYYIPLFAQSIELTPSTGAALVAGFNACASAGRFGSGALSDAIGPVNTLLITLFINAISMLAIWPTSSSLTTLIIFAMLNGVSNGAFFTTMPTVIASIFSRQRAAVAMGMAITGWAGGYLMGAPIAGYLLAAGQKTALRGIDVYWPAIFYAGGLALVASICVLFARLVMDKKIIKKL